MNNDNDESRCSWIYKQGKLAGTRCVGFITKKDVTSTSCCQHYYRIKTESDKKGEIQSNPPPPIKTIDEIEREKRFELRYLKEVEEMKEEALYREFRKMKLQNLI